MNPESLVPRLRQLDTCVVSDALDALGFAGFVLGIRRLSTRRRIAGRAVTLRLVPVGGAAVAHHLGSLAVEAAGPEDVIVVDNGGRLDSAAWGGLLSLAAARRGAGGVVVDGLCRDLDDAMELDFPVFARGAIPVTARGRVVEAATNGPVDLSGVAVSPGDLVIADGSGVVFVALENADAVVAKAEELSLREATLAQAIREGRPLTQVLDERYEQMLEE